MLLEYLAGRSVPCPRCRSDLRDAREPRCPECGETIRLQVGAARPLVGWLILAIAPGIFSGLAGAMLGIPIVGSIWAGRGGRIPIEVWFCESVAVVSIVVLLGIWRWRWRFLALGRRGQAIFAIGLWSLHILAAVYVFRFL